MHGYPPSSGQSGGKPILNLAYSAPVFNLRHIRNLEVAPILYARIEVADFGKRFEHPESVT